MNNKMERSNMNENKYRVINPEKMDVTIRSSDGNEEIYLINEIPLDPPYAFNIFCGGPSPFAQEAKDLVRLKRAILDTQFLRPELGGPKLELIKLVIFPDLK